MDILLTTFPKLKSQNVGDALITDSAIKLVRHRVPSYDPEVIFREDSLEEFDKSEIRTILAPGFSVNNYAYPELFKIYPDVSDIMSKIFVTGCSFQSLEPRLNTYNSYQHSVETKKFLVALAKNMGSVPCRDLLIHEMLMRQSIKSSYIGDLALYDDSKIAKKLLLPKKIRSIAFTIQHNGQFFSQSKKLLALIKREFSEAELYVVHHSKPTKSSKKVSDFASSLGYIEIDLSGESKNLEFYENIDFHIGYRLHGHIFFLRNRKPSCLMVEDCRSFGISKTSLLGTGIFQALDNDGISVRDVAPYELLKFVRRNKESSFKDYVALFQFIDKTYYKIVRPYFDRFSKNVGWKPTALTRFKLFLKKIRLSLV